MEIITLESDVIVMYKTATSFPDGIMAAHQALHAIIPFSPERHYYGVSRPESEDGIVYRAAAEALYPGEADEFNLETLTLRKGRYINVTIPDFMDKPGLIGETFRGMLDHPDLDPQGYCVEFYYTDKDVKCMIRLKD